MAKHTVTVDIDADIATEADLHADMHSAIDDIIDMSLIDSEGIGRHCSGEFDIAAEKEAVMSWFGWE